MLSLCINFTACTSKNNQTKSPSPKETETWPPEKYTEWLNLDPLQLQQLKGNQVNEQFWINFRIFDLLKESSKDQACAFLDQAKKLSPQLNQTHFIQLNDLLFCTENATTELPLTNLENRLYKELLVRYQYKKGLLNNDLSLKITNGIELANLERNRNEKLRFYLALEKELKSSNNAALQNLFSSALKKEFPKFLSENNFNRIEIANDLIKDRDFIKAKSHLNYLVHLSSAKKEDIFKAYKFLYKIEKTKQDKSNQESVLNQWWQWLQKSKKKNQISPHTYESWLVELLVLKSRWHWTDGNPQQAMKLLITFEKRIKDSYKKEELYYTLGRIFEEKKDFVHAKINYEKSFSSSNFKSGVFEKNLWSLAWLEYKNKNYLAAQNHLELLISKIKDDSDSKYRYWLAKCYLHQGKTDSYNTAISQLRTKEPLSFYSLLTYRDHKEKLGLLKKTSLLENSEFIRETLKNFLSPEEMLSLMWHLSFKQNSILKEWAKYISEQSETNFLPSLILYAKAELYSNLITSINQLNSEQKNELLLKFPELLFPNPYLNLVTKYSDLRKIPPSFVYSIMRQESAFDPFARSPVDAMGLLQMMPNLGKKIAKEEGFPLEHDFELFKEETNLFLGTKELSRLLQMNKNKYIPAIAGYNASPAAYQDWVQSRYRDNVIEFIEEIPYEETRTYIKLIIRNMIFYDKLYFQKQEFDFPEYLLTY